MLEDQPAPPASGWDVVGAVTAAGSLHFGRRLVAVYALGSLAHGGFSPLVSDVDVALVLRGLFGDEERVLQAVTRAVRGTGLALATRASIFWGTVKTLSGREAGGRFPPLDRLDLLRHGVLVQGSDIRHGIPEPSFDQLIHGGATFAVEVLSRPKRKREITDASFAVMNGPRTASKVALFPARFLFTSRTGEIGQNTTAVNHYLAGSPTGPAPALLEAALEWRTSWETWDPKGAESLLRDGTIPLYQEFARDYHSRLGQGPLANRLGRWLSSLATKEG